MTKYRIYYTNYKEHGDMSLYLEATNAEEAEQKFLLLNRPWARYYVCEDSSSKICIRHD
ncbi:MAG: hypothetical protein AAB922_06680 [Patescibacteria group bacterium]